MSLKFICPECGDTHLTEVQTVLTTRTPVTKIDVVSEDEIYQQEFDGYEYNPADEVHTQGDGSEIWWECTRCGYIVKDDEGLEIHDSVTLGQYLAARPYNKPRPKVVCICGSTKFKKEFLEAAKHQAKAGSIVLSVGWFSHADGDELSEKQRNSLDELHKRKIDMCDEILVIDVGGYIGESTQSEILYAQAQHKPVKYWESLKK